MIIDTISQGLLWSILGLGIFMTFRILNFPDMTAEGSFPLGGVVAVILLVNGVPPIIATLLAILAGCLAGLVTGLLYTVGKIPTLLSGILVMTSCHSVMLFILKTPSLGLSDAKVIQDYLPLSRDLSLLLVGLLAVILVIVVTLFFLNTRLGQAYIATGDNKDMAKSFGIKTSLMELMGLIVSNGIIALAGALTAQSEGYANIDRGNGVIVIGLASLIIGEVIFTKLTMAERFVSIVVGAILYQFLILAVLALGFPSSYLRIISAIILAVCLMVPVFRKAIMKGASFSK